MENKQKEKDIMDSLKAMPQHLSPFYIQKNLRQMFCPIFTKRVNSKVWVFHDVYIYSNRYGQHNVYS